MRSPYQRPQPRASINITPYIDILLVLLIIFMVIQPTTQFQLGARAPGKPAKTPRSVEVDDFPIVVSIDELGKISINTRSVSFPTLGTTLFEILNARPDRNIFIKGNRELPFGDVAVAHAASEILTFLRQYRLAGVLDPSNVTRLRANSEFESARSCAIKKVVPEMLGDRFAVRLGDDTKQQTGIGDELFCRISGDLET